MAYSDKAKRLRRCKKVKADGTQCRAYARINGQFCSLHGYDHKTKKLPKKNEREAAKVKRAKKRAQTQPHQTCDCLAYNWRHRAGSGICKFPDPPAEPREIRQDIEQAYEWAATLPGERSSQYASEYSSAGAKSTVKRGVAGSTEWERVINYEDSISVQYKEDDLPGLDPEQVPQNREQREAWNRAKLKRLIEEEMQKEKTDVEWFY